jgi:prepilin-type processing-associated H-X9-DG protein
MGLRYEDETIAAWPNGPSVDTWYAINAVFDTTDLTKGPPCHRLNTTANPQVATLAKTTHVRRSSEMVYFFDGVYANYTATNANRISARHAGRNKTNLAFFDGHAATFTTADLPGGLTATTGDFAIANLQAKYTTPPNPMWLLDQQ